MSESDEDFVDEDFIDIRLRKHNVEPKCE